MKKVKTKLFLGIGVVAVLILFVSFSFIDEETVSQQEFEAGLPDDAELVNQNDVPDNCSLLQIIALSVTDVVCETLPEEEIVDEIMEEMENQDPVTAKQITLFGVIKITDDNGEITTTQTDDAILNALELITQTGTGDRPLLNGNIDLELFLKSDDDFKVSKISGKMDVLVNDNSIVNGGIDIAENFLPNTNLPNIVMDTGTVNFKFSKLATGNGNFVVKFVLKDFEVSTESGAIDEIAFESLDTKLVYEIELERSGLQTIIKNSDGEFVRVSPTDDKLKIYTQKGRATHKNCGRSYVGCTTYYSFVSAPPWGAVKVFDSENNVIAESTGTTNRNGATLVDIVLTRNSDYKIQFTSVNYPRTTGFETFGGTVSFKTPPEHQDYSFFCTASVPYRSPLQVTCSSVPSGLLG